MSLSCYVGGSGARLRSVIVTALSSWAREAPPWAAAVFLASDEASFVHGTILDVDGGRTSVAVIQS